MAIAVNEQSDIIKELAQEWAVLEPLMAGTAAMRAGAQKFLPRWPNEELDSYQSRLATATLFPAYRRTVSVMAGKPFAKAVTLQDNNAPQIFQWAEDIDQQGVSLHAFCAEMFAEALAFGLCGILVDYPDTTVRDAQGRIVGRPQRTVAQAEAMGLRPYWVRYKHNQILGWRASLRGGKMQFDQLRLLESVEEPDGDFGSKWIPQVRVLYPGGWQLWRATEKNGWSLYQEGTTTLSYVPFVPIYGKREAFMVGRPPLLDLAYLNIKHWQSQSDQDTILHVARVPILAMIGAEDETSLTVGAQSAVKLPIGADLKFVEHSGAAIAAGKESLAALEEQMIQTGAELLVKKPGDRSATEAANDAEANKSDLQRMVEDFEDSIDLALQYTADYGRVQAGNISLFKDFGAGTLSDASAQLILAMQASGLISKKRAITEMKRRGMLDAEVDAEVELALAESEGPLLGNMTNEDEQ